MFVLGLPMFAATVMRDAYGVPTVKGGSLAAVWRACGRAVAEDRLWQMELSRRLARGRLAEVLGPGAVASDREILSTGYTDAEIQAQILKLSAPSREAFRAYAQGVNDRIQEGNLPPEFHQYQLKPASWTDVDSAAILVRLLQFFGHGGAGELRNMALLAYLKGQPKTTDKILDVFDDIVWRNDSQSPTTLQPCDDRSAGYMFPRPTRRMTEMHLQGLPPLGLLDLLPGIRTASREASNLVAERVAAPFRTGSYCVVVGPRRSATGHPLLLSGPQLGFRNPSIVHEMTIRGGDLDVSGMDIPGVPGILVGRTDRLAWGITSGAADTDDIFYYPRTGDHYRSGSELLSFDRIRRDLIVRGAPSLVIEQARTIDGPVILDAKGWVFARHTPYRNRELETFDALANLWKAKNAIQADGALSSVTMNFNAFYALRNGDIGYRFTGRIPVRTSRLDPRLPTPGDPKFRTQRLVSSDQMPHGLNPRRGLFTNWNNKPADWWTNGDTPEWGTIEEVSEIDRSVTAPKISIEDLRSATRRIAMREPSWPYFAPWLAGKFDGWNVEGSPSAEHYRRFMDRLRHDLFVPIAGGFLSDEYLSRVFPPSLVYRALRSETRFDFLAGRRATDLVHAAWEGVEAETYRAHSIAVPGGVTIPYSNRGSYIQAVEVGPKGTRAWTVLPPGEAEIGSHRQDQVGLARRWQWKFMGEFF